MHAVGEYLMGDCPIGQIAEHAPQCVQDSETRRRYGARCATSENAAPSGQSVRHQNRGANHTRPITAPTTNHAIAAAVQFNLATLTQCSASELITRGSSHLAKFTPAIAAPMSSMSSQNLTRDSRSASELLGL
jgi:hypothetical protein